jgi:hypothetical protein
VKREIGDAAYKVQKSLDPWLLISVYEAVLAQRPSSDFKSHVAH